MAQHPFFFGQFGSHLDLGQARQVFCFYGVTLKLTSWPKQTEEKNWAGRLHRHAVLSTFTRGKYLKVKGWKVLG
jgi:hypothetical protein